MVDREDVAAFAREMKKYPVVEVPGHDEVVDMTSAEHVCEAQIADPTPLIGEWRCPCGATAVLQCGACGETLRIAMDWEDPCEHGLWLANQLATAGDEP